MVNQYVLKVYPLGLGNEVYRTLEICGDSTLDQLCDAIMEAFDFFHEHLYEFCMDNKMFSEHCFPRKKKPCVIKSKGEIQQYPDYEEDSDEE